MESPLTVNRNVEWHPEVLDPASMGTLRRLCASSMLEGFYLAGGTGLALWIGHRKSADLDFFSSRCFSAEELAAMLDGFGAVQVRLLAHRTLDVLANGISVSFLGYRYPLLYPLGRFGKARIADPRDIACMKLSAVAGRGTRRDFLGLYAVAQTYGLERLLALFERKYRGIKYSRPHLLKSLAYFDNAEKDPLPDLLTGLDWEAVKKFFIAQAPRLL